MVLFKYQNKYKKIVMDMLSLLPVMKFINHLKAEMQWYEDDQHRALYLWKDPYDNWGGLIGIEEFPHNILIRRIILNAVNHNLHNYYTMLDEIAKDYPKKKIIGTIKTAKLCNDWSRQHDKLANRSENDG